MIAPEHSRTYRADGGELPQLPKVERPDYSARDYSLNETPPSDPENLSGIFAHESIGVCCRELRMTLGEPTLQTEPTFAAR